jgi:hypothetical protein
MKEGDSFRYAALLHQFSEAAGDFFKKLDNDEETQVIKLTLLTRTMLFFRFINVSLIFGGILS